MSIEEELRNKINDGEVDMLYRSGSMLYGTNRPGSDEDLRGFILPSFEYLIGLRKFSDMDVEGADHKIYNLRRFMDLVLAGDPQASEAFFVGKEHILKITSIGERVLALRSAFISNRIYNRIMGYSYSEWRKAMAVTLKIADRTKDEEDIIMWIRDKKHWEKDRMDEFIDWMNEEKEKKLVPSTRNLGEKRKIEFEKYGFCVSSAAHSLRLTQELTELMLTGTMTFPRPNAEYLRDIRLGKYTKEEVALAYEETHKKAEEARPKSILPDLPDYNTVDKLYADLVKERLIKELI